ncbi:unnamed protein product [Rhizoctonia solani]|uniref:DUF6535 domain-containing protein n=1 Tax=Rhizoctonia solani TaxID=456999 RepID=A0A8H3E0X4_9AGAM|nr:unnamed protein product [Rhizoctonia solani]
MVGRTGPAGAQARRRQQRWDGLVKWRMKELLIILPSLIHLSLLLFAIGLCVFLWDVHYGVAIPVILVTTLAASAYFSCTLLPFLYEYCPYGTVLSRLAKQFITKGLQPGRDSVIQDQVMANALNWMIVTCETPRSVEIALQSLAAADENLPTQVLEKRHAWAMIKQRLECGEVDQASEQNKSAVERYKRALNRYPIIRKKFDNLDFGYYHNKEEQLVLGIQATIRSLIDGALHHIDPEDTSTAQILRQCITIGQYYLSQGRDALKGEDIKCRYQAHVKPDSLAEDLVNCLEKCVSDGVTFNLELYRTLSASLALFLCCMTAHQSAEQSVYINYSLRLIRSYSSDQALDCLWATLMTTAYSDISALKRHDITSLVHGMLYLLANPNKYNLSPEDCEAIETILAQTVYRRGLPTNIQSIYHAHYIQSLTQNITTADDTVALAPQVLRAVYNLRIYAPWDDGYMLPSIEIYIFVVKYLSMAKDSSSTDSNFAYRVLGYSPIPKCSPQLVRALSSSDLITHLANVIDSDDRNTQLFATAQLWVFIHMSICEADRTSLTLSLLETELLKYPKLEGNMERQEAVAEELEDKLTADIDEGSFFISRYTYRVQEVMLQRRSTPLPELFHSRLNMYDTPKRLHGIESFVNYETERSVAYPDLVFDSEGRPSRIPSSEEQRA